MWFIRRYNMPVYEYECQKCGERFEQFKANTKDDNEVKCPRCGAEKPKKIMSGFSQGSACSPSPFRGGG
jgi:putative FmdB family regulatory protein